MAERCEGWFSALEKGLRNHPVEKVPENPDDGAFYAWELTARSCPGGDFFSDVGESILNLWRGKRYHLLTLIWWTSRAPETRLLILSLFKSSFTDMGKELSSMPYFDPARFEAGEAKVRKNELEYIEKHRKEIRGLLKKHGFLPRPVGKTQKA